jgi:hypothetical protein
LLERFANSTSADDLFDAFNNIYQDAQRDPELKGWFREVDAFLRRCLREKGYILEDASTAKYNELYDRGNFLFRERYRDHTDRVLDEFKFIGDQFNQDPLNRAFADSMNKLFQDLGNDENGKPTFKSHLVKDLTQVIVPAIFENTRYVPVPRIEYTDPTIDAIVENLIVESDNLFPNSLEIASENYFKWGRKTVANRQRTKIMVAISGIQMDLRDVSYYVKRKQGFPRLTDTGIMDIFMGGQGLSFKLALETADPGDQHHLFKVNSCDVNVKNLRIKVRQSKHKLLFNLVSGILLAMVRPVVQKVIEKQIVENIQELDALARSISEEAQRAKEAAQEDPEQAQNVYQRYVQATKTVLAEGKQKKKAKDTAADRKANVVVTQDDSIFKTIRLPGGVSMKVAEYQELAAKGDKWESPVFTIGSASPSTNIPKPTPVTRKSRAGRAGGVRGPQNIERSSGAANDSNQAAKDGYGNAQAGTGGPDSKAQSNGTYHTTLGPNNPVVTGSA